MSFGEVGHGDLWRSEREVGEEGGGVVKEIERGRQRQIEAERETEERNTERR